MFEEIILSITRILNTNEHPDLGDQSTRSAFNSTTMVTVTKTT